MRSPGHDDAFRASAQGPLSAPGHSAERSLRASPARRRVTAPPADTPATKEVLVEVRRLLGQFIRYFAIFPDCRIICAIAIIESCAQEPLSITPRRSGAPAVSSYAKLARRATARRTSILSAPSSRAARATPMPAGRHHRFFLGASFGRRRRRRDAGPVAAARRGRAAAIAIAMLRDCLKSNSAQRCTAMSPSRPRLSAYFAIARWHDSVVIRPREHYRA